MKFLVDASSDARLVGHLQSLGHDITRIGTHHPGNLSDRDVLALVHREGRILITDNRDFGELIFRLNQPHTGVIYLRLETTKIDVRRERLDYILTHDSDELDLFLTVTEQAVRAR